MSDPKGVVIVEEASSVRSILRRALTGARGVVLLGETDSPEHGKEMIRHLRPDVVILGLGPAGKEGMETDIFESLETTTPVLVLTAPVASTPLGRRKGLTLLPKPALPEGWKKLSVDLPAILSSLAPQEEKTSVRQRPAERFKFVAIGASAGGPAAVRSVLETAGTSLDRVGVGIVQHIGEGFEEGFVELLAASLPNLNVGIAFDGEILGSGKVRIAPSGSHMEVSAEGRIGLNAESPPENGHRPSINAFFRSLERVCATSTIGLLLSGMGEDGAAGLCGLREGGALCLVQDPSSCAVDGMPRAALRRGAAEGAMSPPDIGRYLAKLLLESQE